MLSGETAMGKYPIEAIRMMAKIVSETESTMRKTSKRDRERPNRMRLSIGETICESMAHAADDLDLSAIAVFTESGTTARQLSKYRPRTTIYGLSSVDVTINRMALLWGVLPIKCTKMNTTDQMVDAAEQLLEEGGYVRPREVIGIVAGTRTKSGSANFLRLHVLGDYLAEQARETARLKEVAAQNAEFAATRATKTASSAKGAKSKPAAKKAKNGKSR